MVEARDVPDASYMRSVVQHHASGVDLVSAPVTVTPLNAVRSETIAAMLDALQANYDYVIVDLPRALVDWIEPVLERTTRLTIVGDTTVPCVRHARRLLDFLREANIGLAIDLVVNRERKPLIAGSNLREAEKALDRKVAHWLPDNSKIARKAADYGVPVVIHAPRSDLARSFDRLAKRYQTARASTSRAAAN
jgi:Flp pilus assembly CpaE family ATPase